MFDSAEAVTADGVEQLAPGPTLADFLSIMESADEVSGYDRVVTLRACQRMVSYYQAQVYRHMAALPSGYRDLADDPALAHDAAAAEIRAALCLTRRAADTELGLAVELAERVPRVWDLLAWGRIDPRRARTILHHTAHLDDETARTVVDQLFDDAPRLTTGELIARLRRLCLTVDPESAKQRYDHAVGERRVLLEPTPCGTATLHAFDLPPDRATAAMNRVDRIAKDLEAAGEARTIDQVRADVVLDLLCGEGTTAGLGVVDLRVDLATLAELAETPGDVAGYGPVIADVARQTADRSPEAEWRFTITHNGHPVGGGTTSRRPTTRQRREVETRYPTCVFPGCRMPATSCDLDHRIPHHRGGPTTPHNLATTCRHDHRIRHRAGWTYRRLANGDHHWTSPLGHTYTTSGIPP